MTPDEIRQHLAGRISEPLFEHCRRASTLAAELARRFDVEVDRAERAALWHDFCKERPAEEQVARARSLGVLTPEYAAHPHLLHGPLAAAVLRAEDWESDPEVLAAIARHTTGEAGMTRLDMIVFLADLLEPGRDFPGVDDLRARLDAGLEAAMLAALDHTLRHLISRGAWIHPAAVAARNALLAFRE